MSFLKYFTDATAVESRLWYESLILPIIAPPSWLFGVAWGILYPLIGIAFAWALLRWTRGTLSGRYIAVFVVNLCANAAFSPIQFGLKNNMWAAVDISVVLVSSVYLVVAAYRPARGIALLLLPYALWVAFATLLQFSIVYLN